MKNTSIDLSGKINETTVLILNKGLSYIYANLCEFMRLCSQNRTKSRFMSEKLTLILATYCYHYIILGVRPSAPP